MQTNFLRTITIFCIVFLAGLFNFKSDIYAQSHPYKMKIRYAYNFPVSNQQKMQAGFYEVDGNMSYLLQNSGYEALYANGFCENQNIITTHEITLYLENSSMIYAGYLSYFGNLTMSQQINCAYLFYSPTNCPNCQIWHDIDFDDGELVDNYSYYLFKEFTLNSIPSIVGVTEAEIILCPAEDLTIQSGNQIVPYNDYAVLLADNPDNRNNSDFLWQYSLDLGETYHDLWSGSEIHLRLDYCYGATANQDIYVRLRHCEGGSEPVIVNFSRTLPQFMQEQYNIATKCSYYTPNPLTLKFDRKLLANEEITNVFIFENQIDNQIIGQIDIPFDCSDSTITLLFDHHIETNNYYIMLEGEIDGVPQMAVSSRLQITNAPPVILSADIIHAKCHDAQGSVILYVNDSWKQAYWSLDNLTFKQLSSVGKPNTHFFLDDNTVTNVPPGQYYCYITASGFGCQSNTITVNVEAAPAISVNFSTTNVSGVQYINGVADTVSDGTVVINMVTNAGGGYTILSPTENLGIGNGMLIISYNKGQCIDSFPYAIGMNNKQLRVEIVQTQDILCYNNANATLEAQVLLDTYSTKTYKWYKKSGNVYNLVGENAVLSNVSAGDYRLTCESSGLQSIFDYTVVQPSSLYAYPTMILDPSCHDFEDGIIAVDAKGGVMPYDFLWSNGENSNVADSLAYGNYVCTVTDSNGCAKLVSVLLINPSPVTVEVYSQIALCNTNNGEISFEASGGSYDYSYWLNGVKVSDYNENLASGIYNYDVIDSKGCTVSGEVDIRDLNMLAISQTIVNQLTYTGSVMGVAGEVFSDASIYVEVIKGLPPYSYDWQNEGNTNYVSNLSAGTYIVTISDANNCNIREKFEIKAVSALETSISISNDISCYGLANGSLKAVVSGGVPPYSYTWNTGTMDSVLDYLQSGNYVVSVRDSNNVLSMAQIYLSQPSQLVSSVSVEQSLCHNSADAFATIDVSGGNLPYSFLWSSGDLGDTAKNLADGLYYVYVSDNNQCEIIDSARVLSPEELVVNVQKQDLSYTGSQFGVLESIAPDGVISIEASGGTGNYRYFLNDMSCESLITGLDSGKYVITLFDEHNCEAKDSLSLHKLEDLQINVYANQYVTCYGENNGEINADVYGGKPPYKYRLNGFLLGEPHFSYLTANYYLVEVEDANHISSIDSVSIFQPEALTLYFEIDSLTGFNNNDGRISPIVSGGTLPYSFEWTFEDNTFNDSVLENAAAGIYFLVVSDANACRLATYVALNNPSPLLISAEIKEVDYVGSNQGIPNPVVDNGEINLSVSGGFSPYYYQWRKDLIVLPDSTNNLENCSTGDYSVRVSDVNGNTTFATFTIGKKPDLILTIHQRDENYCYGDSTATYQAIVSGGKTPYTYLWNTGDTTIFLENLPSGSYYLNVVDSLGIQSYYQIYVTQPKEMIIAAQKTNVSCFGYNDGSIVLNVTGGTESYSYYWENGSTSQNLYNLSAGIEKVTVYDVYGCFATKTIEILQPEAVSFNILEDSIVLCAGQVAEPYIENKNLQYLWLHESGNTYTGSNVSLYGAGFYTVTGVDNNSCFSKDSLVIIRQNDSIDAEIWSSSEAVAGLAYTVVNISNYASDSVLWQISNAENFQILSQNDKYLSGVFTKEGDYNIAMTSYKNGCTISDNAEVVVYAADSLMVMYSKKHLLQNLQIAPNPVKTSLTWQCEVVEPCDIEWQIIQVSTAKITKQGALKAFALVSETIDVSDIPDGVYALSIISNGQQQSPIFIKIK